MSYFDDQYEAWLDNECQGSPDMYDPYSEDIFGAWVEDPPTPCSPASPALSPSGWRSPRGLVNLAKRRPGQRRRTKF